MKFFFLLTVTMLFLAGCIGTKKYTRLVRMGLERALDTNYTTLPDTCSALTIHTLGFSPDSDVVVTKGPHFFIPAILYVGIKQTLNCQLNPLTPSAIFARMCSKYAAKYNLCKLLHGQKLELTVNSIPNGFIYYEREDIIFPIYFWALIAKMQVQTIRKDLSVHYRIINGTSVTREGDIVIEDNQGLISNPWWTTKRITREYLFQYEFNIRKMSADCIIAVINEVEKQQKKAE